MGPIIDLTTLFPYRIIQLFAYSFASYNIVHSILKDRYNSLITMSAIFAARILTSIVFFNKESFVVFGYPSFSLLVFIIILFLTEGKTLSKFICIVFNLISHYSSALIISLLEIVIYQGKNYDEVFGTENPNLDHLYVFLSANVIIIAVSFLFVGILKLFNSRKTKFKNKRIYAYFSFLPFSHIVIIVFSLFLAPLDYSNTPDFGLTVNLSVYIMMTVIIMFDCSFPFIIDYFEKIEDKYLQNEKELVKTKMEFQQIEMLKEEKKEFRKIKHDLANIITTAKGFIEIGKPEKAMAVLQGTNDNLMGLAGFSLCSNETINTIIYIKQQQAVSSGLNMTAEIEEDAGVLIDDYDLCRVLSNIIDNALNAVSLTEKDKICHIAIGIYEQRVVIKSQNSFDPEKQGKTKKSELHGNGIDIIKEIASKYGGKYAVKRENGVWYTETFLNNKKPANSPPPPEFWHNLAACFKIRYLII